MVSISDVDGGRLVVVIVVLLVVIESVGEFVEYSKSLFYHYFL